METANFGTVLREARERRQVSLADVARQTKVSVSALQFLEAGKLADLPHETFVRGFIRSYARTVGISHIEPLSLFDEAVAARRNAETPPSLSRAPRVQTAPVVPPPEPNSEDDATWDWLGGLRDHRPPHRDHHALPVPASAAAIR